ncbi:MAG TPA: family 16 glycosylhydrolase [Candidatus Krumholzibacteria bacterium]|mgnify:CR=1 FL=1|nr:family 16 glycosylhydrolase [Candidatus Krumholzibacteria bacterium]HRX51420.1 family 16 glycosylhydrolase [Candidatus Krumholzibacteria bacterium]
MTTARVRAFTAAIVLLAAFAAAATAQVGPLIWAEEFNDLDNWLIVTGNGYWGWGNGELEYYSADNVSIAPIPGEPGNNGLRITARQESGPGIVDQWGNPLQYTSGKVETKSFVNVRYGMIEARVRVPSLDLGGWPAFWMLGTANYGWPRNGEIDLMEMGGHQTDRDLHDTHNGGNGLDNTTVDQSVSANALFYTDDAVNPGNPSGAASLSYDPTDVYARPYYSYDPDLTDRFLIYRVYWDENSLRWTVEDQGVEHDLFAEPFTIDEESAEFRSPFYLIANLAIGGAYTDAYNLGDPGSGLPVTMGFPAEMWIDSIRVYEWNGMGEVHVGPPTQKHGTFGVFTDESVVDDELVPQVSSEIYVWEGTLVDGTIAPYEGDAALSWRSVGAGWFGAGVMSIQPLNLFDFPDGHLEFMIKIPANVTFQIGIIDAWGNQNYVTFPAGQTTYELVRNGDWGRARIPVQDIRGLAMDLRMLSYPFVVLETQGAVCEFAIDDITWTGGNVASAVRLPSPAAGGALRPNAPNPFNARTEIRFELPDGGAYELAVYDVSGRRVATFSGVGAAGANSVMWDGRDDAGVELASGLYQARLTTAGGTSSRPMLLVK